MTTAEMPLPEPPPPATHQPPHTVSTEGADTTEVDDFDSEDNPNIESAL